MVNRTVEAERKTVQRLRTGTQTGSFEGLELWSRMELRWFARKGQTWRGLPFQCQAEYWPYTALTLTKSAGARQALSF